MSSIEAKVLSYGRWLLGELDALAGSRESSLVDFMNRRLFDGDLIKL